MQTARTDPVESVRSQAVTQLLSHSQAFTEIPETLAWIAGHDEKPGIRRIARSGLAASLGIGSR
jgi:hypothetical protein